MNHENEVEALRRQLDAAIKERDELREDWDHYSGPCPHGRNPWTRCDESDDPQGGGCGNQSEPEAMRRALAHAIKERDEARAALARELDSTGTHLRTCDFVTRNGCASGCDCTCGGVAEASRAVTSTTLRDAIPDDDELNPSRK